MRKRASAGSAVVLVSAGVLALTCVSGASFLLAGPQFRAEVAKALVQLAVVVIAGGLVQILLARRERMRVESEKETDFRRTVLANLGRAHAEIYRVRRLLRVDTTASVYGQQIAKLVEIRILLGDVGHDFTYRSGPYAAVVQQQLKAIRAYLEELIDEHDDMASSSDFAAVGPRPPEERTPLLAGFLLRADGECGTQGTYESRFKQPYLRAKVVLGFVPDIAHTRVLAAPIR